MNINIGTQLKALRKERGLTLQQVADTCGYSKQAISQLEKGDWNISIGKLKDIVEKLEAKLEIIISA